MKDNIVECILFWSMAIFGVLAVLGVAIMFFAIPFIHNDYNAESVPNSYEYRILVQPDKPYNSEYIVVGYSIEGDFVRISGYYRSPVDALWPSARSWEFFDEERLLPNSSVKYIEER